MSNKTYEDVKNEFKDFIIKMEQDIISSSEQIDAQQIANRIIKHFDEISDDFNEVIK